LKGLKNKVIWGMEKEGKSGNKATYWKARTGQWGEYKDQSLRDTQRGHVADRQKK